MKTKICGWVVLHEILSLLCLSLSLPPFRPTGFVPYVITPRHFQESIASSSDLYHLWACLLLCHRLSCAALYGPVSIPSILYLAYLQLESHGFFSFDCNKIWEGQRCFPVSTSNKGKIPEWTFCGFLPSLPDHLHCWPLEGGVYRKWFWTYTIMVDWVPQFKTARFEAQGQGQVMGQEVAVLPPAFWPLVTGGFHQHCRLSGLPLPSG